MGVNKQISSIPLYPISCRIIKILSTYWDYVRIRQVSRAVLKSVTYGCDFEGLRYFYKIENTPDKEIDKLS